MIKLFPERVGTVSDCSEIQWSPSDCSLYALAVGADFNNLEFLLEPPHVSKQLVYPSFPLVLVSADANAKTDPMLGIGVFSDDVPIVQGEQRLELHRPVDPSGSVAIEVEITGLYDKGSGGVVVLEARGTDVSDQTIRYFTATITMFIVGGGGFGGPPGPPRIPSDAPDRPGDHVSRFVTPSNQSLLYMHAGNDDHSIHVDPEVAIAAGFAGPILTGQNSLGIACRGIVHEICAGDPSILKSLGGRFKQPAYNGDTLTTEMWFESPGPDDPGSVVLFRTVNQEGMVIIDGGKCQLAVDAE